MEHLLAALERGDYPQAIAIANAAWQKSSGAPRLALYALRAAKFAGDLNTARDWLTRGTSVDRDLATDAILSLESAHLSLLSRLDIEQALRTAADVDRKTSTLPMDPGDVAELRWLRLRVWSAAAVYRELPPEQCVMIEPELDNSVQELFAVGRIQAALDAAYALADRRTPIGASLAAFEALSARADAHGRPARAAAAALRRAALLRTAGDGVIAIEAEIQRAEQHFSTCDHRYGVIDCARARAELAIDRQGTGLAALEHCVQAYLDVGFPRGAVSALLDLSLHAHRRGDTIAAERFGQALIRLSDTYGLGIQAIDVAYREADLANRRGRYSVARDWCDVALSRQPPRLLKSGLLSLRSIARSLSDDRSGAIDDKLSALAIYDSLVGAEDLATEIISSLASDLAQTGMKADIEEADVLLVKWIARDCAAGRNSHAVAKMEGRVDLCVQQVMRLKKAQMADELPPEAERVLIEADRILDEADILAGTSLSGVVWAQHVGMLAQRRGHIASLRGDDDGFERALLDALPVLAQAGYAFEAANVRYLLGSRLVNVVNASQGQVFAEAFRRGENYLIDALEFYDGMGGMRRLAADTRHKLAMLWLNTHHLFDPSIGRKVRDGADRMLSEAATDIDILRRAFRSAKTLDTRTGKASLSDSAVQLTKQALRLHLHIDWNPAEAWDWVARSKSRALNDLLSSEAEVPRSLEVEMIRDPGLGQLVERERDLCRQLAAAPASERLVLTQTLDDLYAQMRDMPVLREYAELRDGETNPNRDLALAFASAPSCALVDWIVVGDEIWVFVARPDKPTVAERTGVSLSAVQQFIGDYLYQEQGLRMTLRDDGGAVLDEVLAPLVAPLARLTQVEEHLILCPTGCLHAIPLHALSINGQPLLARNPIAYTPSLGVFRLSRLRATAKQTNRAVVFGDPSQDRPSADEVAKRLAEVLGADLYLGQAATMERLDVALARASLVHFQGHAKHCHADPLASHLQLAAGECYTARRLFESPGIQAQTVVLGACESAAVVVGAGDELLGLTPAFLVAGACKVVAAKWRAEAESAAKFMIAFFAEMQGGALPIEAMRRAALDVREETRFSAPYYWAVFALYGDPWRTFR